MIRLIAAMDQERGIGRDGAIPWHIKADLKHFAQLTSGQIVIMGRGTADSLPGWLPNRTNVVVSSQYATKVWIDNPERSLHVIYVPTLEEAFKIAKGHAWVIGGQSLYEQTIAKADELHLTEVEDRFGCDRFFPAIPSTFREVHREKHVGEELPYSFVRYRNVGAR